MTLTPVERGSSKFAAFETALAAAGLPVGDLEADGAQYFAFEHRDDEPLAFVGMIASTRRGYCAHWRCRKVSVDKATALTRSMRLHNLRGGKMCIGFGF